MTGKVTRWNAERGFGFIEHPEFPRGIFVHIKDILADHYGATSGRRELFPGDVVQFDLTGTEKGPRASFATVTESAPEEDSNGEDYNTAA